MEAEEAFIGCILQGVTTEKYAKDDTLRLSPLETNVSYFDDRYYNMPERFLTNEKLN